MSVAAPAGILIGAVGTGIVIGGAKVIGRLFRRNKRKASKGSASSSAPNESSSVRASSQFASPAATARMPVDKLRQSDFTFGSPLDPSTPTMKSKSKLAASSPVNDTEGAHKDQSPSSVQGTGNVSTQETAALKQQLQLLQTMQEENIKLRTFMQEHLATSAKVSTLEQENVALKMLTSKLESEIAEVKSVRQAPPPSFSLANGEELQIFKGMLAGRLPTEARSVCSDTDLFGLPGATGSVDGAATVADMATNKRGGAAHSIMSEFYRFLTMSSGAGAALDVGGAQGPTASGAVPRLNIAGKVGLHNPSQASTPCGSNLPSRLNTPRGSTAVPTNVDLARMLDSFHGGRL